MLKEKVPIKNLLISKELIYFSTLVGLLDRVGLKTNVVNTVGMVYRPYQAPGTQSEMAYERRIKGEGPSYQE